MPAPPLKPVVWLGDSLRKLKAFPAAVQDEMGYAITWRSVATSTCQPSR
jgi:phage-related protein